MPSPLSVHLEYVTIFHCHLTGINTISYSRCILIVNKLLMWTLVNSKNLNISDLIKLFFRFIAKLKSYRLFFVIFSNEFIHHPVCYCITLDPRCNLSANRVFAS